MMTRKHYIKFAKALANLKDQLLTLSEYEEALCEIFEEDNPNFDRDRFIEAINN
jgi:hypothetical protein